MQCICKRKIKIYKKRQNNGSYHKKCIERPMHTHTTMSRLIDSMYCRCHMIDIEDKIVVFWTGIRNFCQLRCVYTIEQSAELKRRVCSSSKKDDIAALLGANLSNTRRENSWSIDFTR
jgi:hypothetical protein